jgi:hypothetical protein
MNKITLALVLGTGLTLSLAAPTAHADAIQTFETPTLSAATFNSQFTPINNAVLSPFRFSGDTADSGLIQSQVFQGKEGTPEAGKYFYAYQVQVNPAASGAQPAHVDSASLQFNATPQGSDLTGAGKTAFGYVITGGQVGGLNLSGSQAPTTLSWQPDTSTGYIRAQYVDPATGAGPLQAGTNSATFGVLSTQPPLSMSTNATTVNIGGGAATTTVPVAYSAANGSIEPIPVPEPATILAWAGMAGAVALVRRHRKSRLVLA